MVDVEGTVCGNVSRVVLVVWVVSVGELAALEVVGGVRGVVLVALEVVGVVQGLEVVGGEQVIFISSNTPSPL